MTLVDVQRRLKLIEASKQIATIYSNYGQVEAACKELAALGKLLQSKMEIRRQCE
jgi:hypothetical protein